MKSVFYLGVLDNTAMTIADKLVYSQILYRSLWDCPEGTFDVDGKFCPENYICNVVPLGDSVSREIADYLNMSERQYYSSVKHLRELDYLCDVGGEPHIEIIDGCFSDEYFELIPESRLSGYSLIFYSYLCYKSAKYGWVDKYHSAIAKDLRMLRSNLERMITNLKNKKLIMTKERGTQSYLAPKKQPYLPFTQNWVRVQR